MGLSKIVFLISIQKLRGNVDTESDNVFQKYKYDCTSNIEPMAPVEASIKSTILFGSGTSIFEKPSAIF